MEVAVKAVGFPPGQPVRLCGRIEPAAERVTTEQTKEESKRRNKQKIKGRQQYHADRPADGKRHENQAEVYYPRQLEGHEAA